METHGQQALTVAVIGDRITDFPPQDSIAAAVAHAAHGHGLAEPVVRWFATPELADDAERLLAGADAIWCAPGSPYASLDGALAGIRVARERGIPFLGTCAGFQHGVLEVARNVLRSPVAEHREYEGAAPGATFFIDELLCSLAGQSMDVHLIDGELRAIYGAEDTTEEYYCRFGLDERHRPALESVGLLVAGTDPLGDGTRIMRLDGHPFFVLTLFVPQTRSRPDAPHPIVRALVAAASGRRSRLVERAPAASVRPRS